MGRARSLVTRTLALCTVPMLVASVTGVPLASAAEPRARVAAPASASAPLRVLIHGDSISQGRDSDWTWRYRFAKEAQRQGVALDFVGSLTATHSGQGRYADPRFDRQHHTIWGTTLERQVPLIEAEVRAQKPDVIVHALGIVDLSYDSPAVVEGRLRQWIANVRKAAPNVRIVISPTLARREFVTPEKVAAYAARQRAVAAELSTTASPITVADTDQGWSYPRMTWDGTHPQCVGELHIAYRVAQEMTDVGVLPKEPAVPGRCTTLRPTEAPSAIRFGAKRIAWDPPTPRATSYRVRYWIGARRYEATVTAPALRRAGVTKARVWAQNSKGRGPSRVGERP